MKMNMHLCFKSQNEESGQHEVILEPVCATGTDQIQINLYSACLALPGFTGGMIILTYFQPPLMRCPNHINSLSQTIETYNQRTSLS